MILYFAFLLGVTSSNTLATGPRSVVAKFCETYLKQTQETGLLEGDDRRRLAPLLSRRLLRLLDDAAACQQDWSRQQPKGSTDKPPFVDCCLFSSSVDWFPNPFRIGPAKKLPDGRYEITVMYRYKTKVQDHRWRDAFMVKKERGRYVIDDFVGDINAAAPEKPFLLSHEFRDCRDGRWGGVN